MDIGKIVFGAILLLVAVYLFIAMEGLAARLIGGGIVAILGIASIVKAFIEEPKKKKK